VVLQAYNMAALWQLPMLFVVENNHFGMGTSEARGSKAVEFYKRGDYIPGLWIDGMDALAVKQGVAFAKAYALENGPVVIEMDTYRYHG
jgi:pyruvate dehydrogenase E1 component alpha subunit